jgi:chloride channel 3/4/5
MQGFCQGKWWLPQSSCCRGDASSNSFSTFTDFCPAWQPWSTTLSNTPLSFTGNTYLLYVFIALLWGLISSSLTLLTYRALPAPDIDTDHPSPNPPKGLYMAGGSGIPEIKTILSGFVIRGFLSFRVLCVKAVGAVFATGSGMCLGKEGPFVHVSACVGNLISRLFEKYSVNEAKKREMLSASVASGLSVAFGAPVGGVLFAMEEISYYFPAQVLWRAFLCSMVAAITLKGLNPFGTGKLVLFATSYANEFEGWTLLLPLFLGISGGVFGAVFIKMNYIWSKWFRSFGIIKGHPVLEVAIVVVVTGLSQWPNVFTRVGGDELIREMLVDCRERGVDGVLCVEKDDGIGRLVGLLISGIVIKLILTSVWT